MKRSAKQVIKVLTLSGVLGALGGLLSPPRLKSFKDGSKDVSLAPDTPLEEPIAPVAEETLEEEVVSEEEVKPKKKPPASKSKTAAATKPKPSSTSRISKASKPRSKGAEDQSGGSEK